MFLSYVLVCVWPGLDLMDETVAIEADLCVVYAIVRPFASGYDHHNEGIPWQPQNALHPCFIETFHWAGIVTMCA